MTDPTIPPNLTEDECEEWRMAGINGARAHLRTISDLRARLADVERERDEARAEAREHNESHIHVADQLTVALAACAEMDDDGLIPMLHGEIARLRAEVERQSQQIEALHIEHEKVCAAHQRALAAGPAALRFRSCTCATEVEAAQAAALKGE